MKVSFGEFTLDADTRQLTRGHDALHLSPKAFQLLSFLVRSRPSVVDRATLRQHLWPDTHVVDAALGNLMAEIRSELGESGAPFLRTVHGVGYAFSGDARDERSATRQSEHAPQHWLVWNDRTIVLDRPESVIGRDPRCPVWIDADGVSRRHSRIEVSTDDGTVARIEDLDSTNGTYLNGKRVTHAVPIGDGDTITLGEATLTFRAWRHADAPTKRVRPPKR